MQRLVLSELEPGGTAGRGAAVLREVQRAVLGCQRCIVITGAGISVSSGIPDFRSPDGLFQQLKQKYPGAVASGRDLFDATLFHDSGMVGLFYSFVGELRNLVSQATCTPTHAFIKQLDEHNKLQRCYTQNIDSLEQRVGLETAFQSRCAATATAADDDDDAVAAAAASGRQSSASDRAPAAARESDCAGEEEQEEESRPPPPPPRATRRRRRQATLDKTFTRAVQLHGSLDNVICTICRTRYPFTDRMADEFRGGSPPPCPRCKELEVIRGVVGKRSVATGVLRPNIVLYNEAHPQAELIGELSEYDLKRRPDLLIVIGTSLRIPGIKRMIREMSRCVRSCTQRSKRAGAGKTIFINRDEPPRGWEDVFDYYIAGDADQAINLLPVHSASAAPEQQQQQRQQRQQKRPEEDEAAAPKPKRARRKGPKAEKPLSLLLPAAPRAAGLARRAPAKQQGRKLTSMLRVVKGAPAAAAKPAPPKKQHIAVPTSPPVPPPPCG
ncbi:NAD-dependent deacetylase hst3 [Coemansia javaensis]|uniref:NAD-dependent deacetylase hst3 n=1 Tax=Coemansia javaensis TaxID=2761396 RepID=A0A9W8LHK3_9FUNG|nr:NAD-dependent deacetylase hst3 [Coemansia javaensis]